MAAIAIVDEPAPESIAKPLTQASSPIEAAPMDGIDTEVVAEDRETDPKVLGTWRITEMEVWDQDAFELLGPAHFTFEKNGLGNFRFIAVEGDMDCRFSDKDGKPLVEFSWNGADENDPACGRGWAVVDGDTMAGRIYIHRGDDSAFVAKRQGIEKAKRGRHKRAKKHGA
jgi:hypothetical protein